MKNMRPKRKLTKEDKDFLLGLNPESFTLKFLQSILADHYDAVHKKVIPSRFNTYDEFELLPSEYFNKEKILTNVGLFIFNKFLIEEDFQEVIGYINIPLNKKQVNGLSETLALALLEDKITSEQYVKYLDKATWLAFSINTEICTSLTVHGMKELPEITKAKEEYLKTHPNVFNEEGDPVESTKMEAELVKKAQELLKDDPSYLLYMSGARGSFDVAYKNNQIMKGAVYNNSTNRFDVMTKSLSSGTDKDDVPTLANNLINAAYAKAIATGDCGYDTKKLAAGFQSLVLDEPGSDCGSKMYDDITITKDNIIFYRYNYILENGKLKCLTGDIINNYVGKTVKMRSNGYCMGKKTCNVCAGNMYYLLGLRKYGLTVSKLSNSQLNYRMKEMHAATVHTWEIKPDEDF